MRRLWGLLLGMALPGLAACQVSPDGADWSVRFGTEAVTITNAAPGTGFTLDDGTGSVVASGTADAEGNLVLRDLASSGHHVLTDSNGVAQDQVWVRPLTQHPPQSWYDGITLSEGVNYIPMRDGVTLSAYVVLPGPIEDGPYPTVVEYSGYDPSNPTNDASTYLGGFPDPEGVCASISPVLCNPPAQPSSLIAGLFGYAVVGVNVRGTGCSGGAFDFFDGSQKADAYDVIETVAAQDWVAHNHVGMIGLSYPGISQLYAAATGPPSLAAIAPMSVISDAANVVRPNGIINDGFGAEWTSRVQSSAQAYGQGWSNTVIAEGDTVCDDNQSVRSQNVDLIAKIEANPFYTDEVAGPLDIRRLAADIDVPVRLTSQWQDGQTGGTFHFLMDDLSGTDAERFTVANGTHADGFAPFNLTEWKTFLDLYVALEKPSLSALASNFAPVIFDSAFGVSLQLEPMRFDAYPDHASALAAWEAEDPVRVVFESGAGDPANLGAPVPRWEERFASWPPPETIAERWYLRGDGSLSTQPPSAGEGASMFRHDPDIGDDRYYAGGTNGLFESLPTYNWQQEASGDAVVMTTPPLTDDLPLVGTASVDLWLRVDGADDTDLEVTLVEVRPDGQEMLIQTGVQRASYRGLAPTATELLPEKSGYEADVSPLPSGVYTEVRVDTHAFAHVLRAGSRLQLVIDTPGGDEALWNYELLPHAGPVHTMVGHDAAAASSIALPVVPTVTAPPGLPPCESLRGQPCRSSVPYTNTPATLLP